MAAVYDVVIFGATGFTGEKVLFELAKHISTGFTPRRYSVAVAGRRPAALADVITRTRTRVPAFTDPIATIIADVSDQASLVAMARSARLLISAVGPYRFYGLPVISAAVEAGCCYIDVTGEPEFMEKAELQLHDKAVANNSLCVSCCGFDSVPADIGALFAADTIRKAGGATTSIDSFFTVRGGPHGFAGHYATFESAVHGFGSVADLRKTRTAMAAKLANAGASHAAQAGGNANEAASLLMKKGSLAWYGQRASRPKGSFFWSALEGRYALPFMGSDASVVRRSQRILQQAGVLAPGAAGVTAQPPALPIQYSAYVTVKNGFYLAVLALFGSIMGTLAQWRWGRALLLRFPRLFTFGYFSHEGPTEEQMATTDFVMTFYAKGYSASKVGAVLEAPWGEGAKPPSTLPAPDVTATVRVAGPEPGYVATPRIMLACAYTILEEREHLAVKAGVVTPGAAFYGSGLIPRLQACGIDFAVLSVNQQQ